MLTFPVTPAQLVAARAMVNLSQGELATAAEVSPSTLRDLEAGRRPMDGDAARAVCRELDNRGVTFIPSDAAGGPGVRLASHRPTLLREPSVVMKWEGVPLEIEFQGQARTAFVSREALEDLDRISGAASEEQLLAAFKRHRGHILEVAGRQIIKGDSLDKHERVHLRSMDFFGPAEPPAQPLARNPLEQLERNKRIRLDPKPRRIWQGRQLEPQDHIWWVHRVDLEKSMVILSNEITGHYLHLWYPAHIQDVVPNAVQGDEAEFLVLLAVDVVFEDGHARLERPRGVSANR